MSRYGNVCQRKVLDKNVWQARCDIPRFRNGYRCDCLSTGVWDAEPTSDGYWSSSGSAATCDRNAQRLNITNATFLHGSWFEPWEWWIRRWSCEVLVDCLEPTLHWEEWLPFISRGCAFWTDHHSVSCWREGFRLDIRYISENARRFWKTKAGLAFEHKATKVRGVR